MQENWSRQIYRVDSISDDNKYRKPQYSLVDDKGERLAKIFYRQDLQLINKRTLMKDVRDKKENDNSPILPKNTVVEDLLILPAKQVKEIYKKALGKEFDGKLSENNRRKIMELVRKELEKNT